MNGETETEKTEATEENQEKVLIPQAEFEDQGHKFRAPLIFIHPRDPIGQDIKGCLMNIQKNQVALLNRINKLEENMVRQTLVNSRVGR